MRRRDDDDGSEGGSRDGGGTPPDLVRRLVADCIERLENEGEDAVEEVCHSYPEHAGAIRERLAKLRAAGFLQQQGGTDQMPERLGDYRLLRRLGGGGMGGVYLAEQISLGREVALKLIRPEHLYFDGARQRFRREVEAVARLQHPGIVPVYTVGEEGGIPFFAMERVLGASLADVLAALQGRMPASLLATDLARALGPALDAQACPFQGD